MQQAMNAVGYGINEYLLILQPNEELENKIREIKESFADKYKMEQARWGRPHITLVRFVQYDMMEQRLLSRLRTIAMGSPAIRIELKDYGSFPSHTIYVNVVSKVPIQSLVKTVRSEAQRLMKLETEKPHFIMEPHISIARKLAPWQYEKGWLEYSHRQFTGRFIADAMLLLKRRQGDKAYQIVERLAFQNLPVLSVQGQLF